MKYFLTFLFGFGLTILNAQSNQSIIGLQQELQSSLDQLITKHETPGLTFSVVMPNGEVLAMAAGLADRASQIKMTPEHKMLGGSTGKVFYSVVIMQLVEEGKLALDEPISTYLGHYNWFGRLPNAEGLTLRNLMRHESGIPRYVFKDSFQKDVLVDPNKAWEPAELLTYVLDDDPMFEVGASFEYSDTNYIIACMAVEEVTGNDLFDEVDQRVVKKAGLQHIDFQNKRAFKGMAQGYNEGDPFFPGLALEDGQSKYNWQFEWGGGGIVITAQDLAVLGKKIYEGEMFSKDLLLEYFNGRDALRMGGTWGLGVHIRGQEGDRIYGHSGFMPGYITNMMYFEQEGIAVCYQINGSAQKYRSIMRELPALANKARQFVKN